MNKSTSMAALYQAHRRAAADVEQVLAALEYGAAAPEAVGHLAQSSEAALVARLLRELEPESRALAGEVEGLRSGQTGQRGHRRRGRAGATPAGRRQVALHWLGAAAASVALVAAGVLMLGRMQPAPVSWDTVAVGAGSAALPDRIFTDRDRIFAAVEEKPAAGEDGLFRADFGGS